MECGILRKSVVEFWRALKSDEMEIGVFEIGYLLEVMLWYDNGSWCVGNWMLEVMLV